MIPNNARALCLTAAAGTELAGASSGGTVTRDGYSPPRRSSPLTVVYTPKGVLPHAASLGQPCGHCPRFPTAASRRSLGRVSVPMWGAILSDPLAVVALVGHHPTNQLIAREPLPAPQHRWEARFPSRAMRPRRPCGISPGFPGLSPAQGHVAHVLLTRPPVGSPKGPPSTCMC